MKTIKQKPEKIKPRIFSKKRTAGCILFLLLVVSLLFYKDTLQDIISEIRNVTWTELGISILLAFFGYLLEGLTISVIAGTLTRQVKAKDGIFIAFVCEFYRLTTLGNGSGIAEIHYLHEKEVQPGSATILTMIQYMMKRTAIMLFGIIGYIYLFHKETTKILCREYIAFMAAGCFVTVLIIIFFLGIALSSKITGIISWMIEKIALKIPSQRKRLMKWKEQLLLLNSSGKNILDHRTRMLGIVFLQIGKALAFYAVPACLLHGEIDLAMGECILIMAVAFMLAGVIPAPSGAGALEFVFLLFFTCFVEPGRALSVILLFRFATWICPAAAGAILLLGRRLFEKKKEAAQF